MMSMIAFLSRFGIQIWPSKFRRLVLIMINLIKLSNKGQKFFIFQAMEDGVRTLKRNFPTANILKCVVLILETFWCLRICMMDLIDCTSKISLKKHWMGSLQNWYLWPLATLSRLDTCSTRLEQSTWCASTLISKLMTKTFEISFDTSTLSSLLKKWILVWRLKTPRTNSHIWSRVGPMIKTKHSIFRFSSFTKTWNKKDSEITFHNLTKVTRALKLWMRRGINSFKMLFWMTNTWNTANALRFALKKDHILKSPNTILGMIAKTFSKSMRPKIQIGLVGTMICNKWWRCLFIKGKGLSLSQELKDLARNIQLFNWASTCKKGT